MNPDLCWTYLSRAKKNPVRCTNRGRRFFLILRRKCSTMRGWAVARWLKPSHGAKVSTATNSNRNSARYHIFKFDLQQLADRLR